MIQKFVYKRATMEDIDELVRTRIIVLRAANKLPDDEDMSVVEKESYAYYRRALETGEHIAYLVYDNGAFVGAGGVSFYQVMPTYHNPTGKKAYIMNMYTAPEYRRQGIDAGYLPLAADVETFYPITVTEADKKEYGAEISLVGKLYQTVYPQYMAPLKEYDRGYLEGVIAAQKKVYGGYFLPDFITDDLIERMNAVYQKQWNGEITVNHREIEFLLASEITRRERQEILTLLSNHFDVALYSGEQNVAIPKIRKKNYIDYYTQMPKVFKCSKVNLNISLKTIRTGIPLRVLDILASGGFVISNFQEELAEYFRLGEEIITYGDIEELYYLVNYYLQHEEERKEIADRGLQRVKEDFRFEERMKVILEDL